MNFDYFLTEENRDTFLTIYISIIFIVYSVSTLYFYPSHYLLFLLILVFFLFTSEFVVKSIRSLTKRTKEYCELEIKDIKLKELLDTHFFSELTINRFSQKILEVEDKINMIENKIELINNQRIIQCECRKSMNKLNQHIEKTINDLKKEKAIYTKRLCDFKIYLIDCVTNGKEIGDKYHEGIKILSGE